MNFQHVGNNKFDMQSATGLLTERATALTNALIQKRGHDRPPFLPEEFARLLGIKRIETSDLGDTSGILLRLGEGYVIKLNQKHTLTRQHFSCAHEIGHVLLAELKLESYIQDAEYRTVTFNPQSERNARDVARETLCDIAAAELLMPELVFRKHLSTSELSITTVEHMASAFSVSILAAARRIAEVSVEPCINILWQPDQKNKPKGLRPMIGKQPSRNAKYLTMFKPVSVTSALYNAYHNDAVVKTWKLFKDGKTDRRIPIEAKGFGSGDTRFVISFTFPERGKSGSVVEFGGNVV